jgi:gluconokinase
VPVVDVEEARKPFVLALDIGTSSTRALVFDGRGHSLRNSERQLPFDLVTTPDGGAEVDARVLRDLVYQSIDLVLKSCPVEISAVGISCFWHSLLGLDRAGQPTTPVYLWADTRSRDDVDAIKREYDSADLWRRTGCFVHSSYWPGKLRWLQRVLPGPYHATARWCGFGEYLVRDLFGHDGVSVSMASSTALLNATGQQWDDMAVAASGINLDNLPPIIDQTQPLTGLSPSAAARWPALSHCPWFWPIGDGACANVGCGGIGPHRIALTVGTSGALRMVAPRPPGTELATPKSLWTYRLDDQGAVVGAAISNGGKVVDWISDLTHAPLDGTEMARAATMKPDAHGLTLLPFLAGERAPIWSDWVTGTVAGLKLATTPADLLRAGMESVSYRLARLYADLSTTAAQDHQILANGGAILASEAWLQMLADVFQHPIVALPPEEESSARGAALLALLYAGLIDSLEVTDDPVTYGRTIDPNPENAAIYQAAMARQQRLYDLLYENGKPRLDSPAPPFSREREKGRG